MFGQDDQQNDNQQTTDDTNNSAQVVSPQNKDAIDASIDSLKAHAVPPPSEDNYSDDSTVADNVLDTSGDQSSSDSSQDDSGSSQAPTDESLEELKQQAVQQLSPLVKELDQEPAEKFRTLLLLVQSTDDKTLLKEAYQVAQNISDKQEQAKALLAIINEIDYFNQAGK